MTYEISEKGRCNEFGAFYVQQIIIASPTTASMGYFIILINKAQQ